MGRPKSRKSYELVDVDGAGMAFYFTMNEAIGAATDYWKLRWGWSIWKIEREGKRTLWVQTQLDDYCWPQMQPILDEIHKRIKPRLEAKYYSNLNETEHQK